MSVRDWHNQAMEKLNNGELQEAFEYEKLAARLVPITDKSEPTLGILYRSTASIALQLGWSTVGLDFLQEYRTKGTKAPLWLLEQIEDVENQLLGLT